MSAKTPRKPTEKEAFFFLSIIANNKSKLDVDWDTVAKESGYNNGATAATRFGQIKKALGLNHLTAGSGASKSKVSKKVGSGTNVMASKVTKNTKSTKDSTRTYETSDFNRDDSEDHEAPQIKPQAKQSSVKEEAYEGEYFPSEE